MSSTTKLLFVDDEGPIRRLFRKDMGQDENVLLETASDGKEALKKLKTVHADIVITDVKMPHMDGLTLLEEIRIRYPDIFVVILTGYGSVEDAVKAMKAEVYDYILKPFDFDVIRMVMEKITDHKAIIEKSLSSGKELRKGYRFENIIGQDPTNIKNIAVKSMNIEYIKR